MNIALDVMGGDRAPQVTISGAIRALTEIRGIKKIFLVGPEKVVKSELDQRLYADAKFEIVDAPEIVDMAESGLKAVRQKKKSSLSVICDLVKKGDADAAISAGNTGAMVAASRIKMRSLEGVEMPGIAAPMPNHHGPNNILDAGANVHAKAVHLLHYAIMGSVYAKEVQGIPNPIVGLMSVGEEDEKGTDFTKEVFELLKTAPINFKGNVEGHDLFATPLHVTVCDGFTGNVMLKSAEASAKMVSKYLKDGFRATPFNMLAGVLSKPVFNYVKKRTSQDAVGGCPLLGVNGVSVIGHGSSNDTAVMNAIRVGAETYRRNVNPQIEEAIAELK